MKNPETIGRLERVALREVWKHEAYDFTRWLEDNIDVLNETLRLNLQNIERERAAGAFSIDLVAEDESGAKIIIENQLEKSNHDHLGKVLTYLAAMKARGAIWIVAEPRPEHVAAVAWLNDSSSADFYLVKVEAVRIGTSPAAPLLTLIAGPSAETEAVAKSNEEFKERHSIRQRWWTVLLARPEARLHKQISPGIYTGISASAGFSGISLTYEVTRTGANAKVVIQRNSEAESKALFDQLAVNRDAIDRAFGSELIWARLEGQKRSWIGVELEGGYRLPEDEWPDVQTRVLDAMNRLDAAIKPYLRALKLGQPEPTMP